MYIVDQKHSTLSNRPHHPQYDHPAILTTILTTINILVTHHVHKTARTDDQLANVSSDQPRNPIWIDTQLCFTNEFRSYYIRPRKHQIDENCGD